MHKQLLLGLTLAVALSGCQKKAEGQTVAVVNKDEITSSEINGELANAKLPPDVDKKEATNRILQSLIDRRLLAEQARQDGIDQSPEFIARQRRMNDELLIGMLASRQMDSSKLPTDAEITAFQNKYPQAFAKREIWKLDQIQYQTPTDPAVKAKILQTKTMDQLIGVLTAARVPFQRASNQIASNVIPPDMYPRLAALAAGEPFIVPNGATSVASSIVGRDPAPLTGPQARTEAVNLLRRQQSGQALQQRLKDLRKNAKIEYKEGFGPPAK
jgi:peptidyl-prolyl cis-trans isomerase C